MGHCGRNSEWRAASSRPCACRNPAISRTSTKCLKEQRSSLCLALALTLHAPPGARATPAAAATPVAAVPVSLLDCCKLRGMHPLAVVQSIKAQACMHRHGCHQHESCVQADADKHTRQHMLPPPPNPLSPPRCWQCWAGGACTACAAPAASWTLWDVWPPGRSSPSLPWSRLTTMWSWAGTCSS